MIKRLICLFKGHIWVHKATTTYISRGVNITEKSHKRCLRCNKMIQITEIV